MRPAEAALAGLDRDLIPLTDKEWAEAVECVKRDEGTLWECPDCGLQHVHNTVSRCEGCVACMEEKEMEMVFDYT